MFQTNLLMHVVLKFTAMLKQDDANTYGETGRTFSAFSFSEIEGSQWRDWAFCCFVSDEEVPGSHVVEKF